MKRDTPRKVLSRYKKVTIFGLTGRAAIRKAEEVNYLRTLLRGKDAMRRKAKSKYITTTSGHFLTDSLAPGWKKEARREEREMSKEYEAARWHPLNRGLLPNNTTTKEK